MTAPRDSEAGFGPDVASEADRPPLAPEGTGAELVRLDEVGTAVIVALSVFPQLGESFLRVRAARNRRWRTTRSATSW